MEKQKAIEILSDSANRGITTHNADFKDALRMGIQALQFLNSAHLRFSPQFAEEAQVDVPTLLIKHFPLLFDFPYNAFKKKAPR